MWRSDLSIVIDQTFGNYKGFFWTRSKIEILLFTNLFRWCLNLTWPLWLLQSSWQGHGSCNTIIIGSSFSTKRCLVILMGHMQLSLLWCLLCTQIDPDIAEILSVSHTYFDFTRSSWSTSTYRRTCWDFRQEGCREVSRITLGSLFHKLSLQSTLVRMLLLGCRVWLLVLAFKFHFSLHITLPLGLLKIRCVFLFLVWFLMILFVRIMPNRRHWCSRHLRLHTVIAEALPHVMGTRRHVVHVLHAEVWVTVHWRHGGLHWLVHRLHRLYRLHC